MIAVALPDYIRRKQAYPRPDHGSVRPPSRHSRASVARGLVPNVVAVTAGVRNTALTVPALPGSAGLQPASGPPAGTQSLWLHVSLHCHDAAIPLTPALSPGRGSDAPPEERRYAFPMRVGDAKRPPLTLVRQHWDLSPASRFPVCGNRGRAQVTNLRYRIETA